LKATSGGSILSLLVIFSSSLYSDTLLGGVLICGGVVFCICGLALDESGATTTFATFGLVVGFCSS
jgi:hypothetical protein